MFFNLHRKNQKRCFFFWFWTAEAWRKMPPLWLFSKITWRQTQRWGQKDWSSWTDLPERRGDVRWRLEAGVWDGDGAEVFHSCCWVTGGREDIPTRGRSAWRNKRLKTGPKVSCSSITFSDEVSKEERDCTLFEGMMSLQPFTLTQLKVSNRKQAFYEWQPHSNSCCWSFPLRHSCSHQQELQSTPQEQTTSPNVPAPSTALWWSRFHGRCPWSFWLQRDGESGAFIEASQTHVSSVCDASSLLLFLTQHELWQSPEQRPSAFRPADRWITWELSALSKPPLFRHLSDLDCVIANLLLG